MAEFTVGDVVVLKSGSMRMIVVAVDGDDVSLLWANEGAIGRDTLPAFTLNKWEQRDERPFTPRGDSRPPFQPRGDKPFAPRGDRPFTPRPPREDGDRPFKPRPPREDGDERPARPFGGDRKGGGKPFGGKPGGFGGGKPGMDGKPKARSFYRKDE